ncbi:LpqN/LpqT family lipoprotein [Mycolicibacterium vaccae]|uniref:LpqN/LpqT family lipoprotein n=1 Tax=Mycolicibacterium vaccae TaxID=1810 RepID=UPI003CFA68C6
MTNLMRAGAAGLAAVAIGIGLTACGSESEPAETTSPAATSETSAEATPPTTEPAADVTTLDDYIAENNLVRTPVLPGDPGNPTVELPTPPGWTPMGPDAPDDAFSAISYAGDPALSTEPATIVTRVFRLTGNVDPDRVLEYSPAQLRTLPQYEPLSPEPGQRGELSGFPAMTFGALYARDGVPYMIARKTVVVPEDGGLLVVQIDAEGDKEQAMALMDATAAIDKEARIVP